MRIRTRHRQPTLLMCLLLLSTALGACGGDGTVRWRGMTVQVPPGWHVVEETDTLLTLANADLQDESFERTERPRGLDDLTARIQFTHEPNTTMADVRTFVEEQGGDIESDTDATLGSLPADSLIFTYETLGTVTREQVVVVPARRVVVLLQPVPPEGATDARDLYLDHADEFDDILQTVQFGAPVDE